MAGLDAAETGVATPPPRALARLELFGYRASLCAFLVLRKPRFMMNGIGGFLGVRAGNSNFQVIAGEPLLNE
jgi:hypothetical protein